MKNTIPNCNLSNGGLHSFIFILGMKYEAYKMRNAIRKSKHKWKQHFLIKPGNSCMHFAIIFCLFTV